jgi:fructose-bisphosphate aldolase class 1
MRQDLGSIAAELVAGGKGILAADESTATLTRRFDKLGVPSTEQSRRAYREMLFTTSGAAEFISGAILYDETIRQKSADGTPLAQVLSRPCPPGCRDGGLARAGRKPESWPASLLSPRPLQQRCRARRVHGSDGSGMMGAGSPARRRERRDD